MEDRHARARPPPGQAPPYRRRRHRRLLPGGRPRGRAHASPAARIPFQFTAVRAAHRRASAATTTSSRPTTSGFGHSDAPSVDAFAYTFDALADLTEKFLVALGLDRFTLYAFDFGGPVGFRIATRHPEWIEGLVVQNANAYPDGLSDAARELTALKPGVPGAEDAIRGILTLKSPAASTKAAPPTRNSSPPTAGPPTSTSSTCPAAPASRSPWASTTTRTSRSTRTGRSGCARAGRPRWSSGAATTSSSRSRARTPTCATCPTPNSTSWTPELCAGGQAPRDRAADRRVPRRPPLKVRSTR
ncbi:alpha/beta fold hydrolase [Yinghuangia aomiensis]